MSAALVPALVVAQGKGKGGGKGHGKGGGQGNQSFAEGDVAIILGYAAEHPGFVSAEARRLPPGLAKNLRRGKALPPGWQKKVVVFPVPLEQRLRPLPIGYRRVIVDRWALVIADATDVVLDVIDLVRN